MKTIRISDEVWNAIAANGKFGETEDTVLRRVLNVGSSPQGVSPSVETRTAVEANATIRSWKQRRASLRMTQTVIKDKLVLAFDNGSKKEWQLPPREDGRAIRKVRDEAVAFVKQNGGTVGQEHAAIRALTSRGYHVTVKTKLPEFA